LFFYVIGGAKQRATNVLWTLKAKEQSKERKKRKSDILFQILSLEPFIATILCSFLIHFEWFQRLKMCYLKIYKTCFKWKVKTIIVEELKLENHIEHLWKNSKHNPLHFERAYLVHFPIDCNVFYIFGYARWRSTNFFKFQKEQTMVKRVRMIQNC
jgi:hypothetical protein